MKFNSKEQLRQLLPDEVPSEFRDLLDFNCQMLKEQTDGTKRLYIRSSCSKCSGSYARRVSDLRIYFKQNNNIVWLCPECRKDAKWYTHNGYVMLYRPAHPNARKDGGILEHVFVMSEKIGRPLAKGENVHHKNGSRSDNRPENLELWSTGQPAGQRIEDKVRWAIELKDQYPSVWKRVRAQMLRESNG